MLAYDIDLGARSRLNAVLFTDFFIGLAIGSAARAPLLMQWGWMAVTGLATASAAAATLGRLWPCTALAK